MTPNAAFLEYAGILTKFLDLAIGQRNRMIQEGIQPNVADQTCHHLYLTLVNHFLTRTTT